MYRDDLRLRVPRRAWWADKPNVGPGHQGTRAPNIARLQA